MEYVENGDFATGDFQPWVSGDPAPVIDNVYGRTCARFSSEDRLYQDWAMSVQTPIRARLSMDVMGDGGDSGIYVTLTFTVAGVIEHLPFTILVEANWKAVSLIVALPVQLEQVKLSFYKTTTREVLITHVSFSDQVSGYDDVGIEAIPKDQQ